MSIVVPPPSAAADPAHLDEAAQAPTALGHGHARNERRTWIVAAICTAMLIAQLIGGALFHSVALSAAGLHMAAHVAVLLTAAGAYALTRRLARDTRFAFGAGKLGYLAGFANAVVLAVTAVSIVVESVERLVSPEAVDFAAAAPLAAVGLVVNVVCMWLLKPAQGDHAHHDPDGDLNLSAVHLHLGADAATSVLTLAALAAGARFGWRLGDPLAGLVGAALVAQFAIRLLRRTGAALLDINPSPKLTDEVRRRLEADGARVADLRVWRLAPGRQAVLAVVEAAAPRPVEDYRRRLSGLEGLTHLTVEVRGPDESRVA